MSMHNYDGKTFKTAMGSYGPIACTGMSLLDYLAGQALVGMASRSDEYERFEHLAADCYSIAHKMLAEKEKAASSATTSETIRFNVNWHVRVRLTDIGRKAHRAHYDWHFGELMRRGLMTYAPPTEDAEGWSRWALHELMFIFGDCMCMGCGIPFETNVILEIEQ